MITTLLWGTALWRSFGEQLWGAGAALHGSFEEPQLWGAAFGSNFEEYLSGTALANSHGEPLWGTGLKHSRFGATALQRCFGERLGEAASVFGEQLSQLYEQLRGAAFSSSFREQLSDSFGEQLWSFGELLWDAAFGSNFEEQLWGATVGSNLRL